MHSRRKKEALLLGLGLDNDDGHVRITRGTNFRLFGGSQETHEQMQDKAIHFNEQLKKREKRLEDINVEEFHEIAESIGMNRLPPKPDNDDS